MPKSPKAKASNVRRLTPRAHRPFVLCAPAYPYAGERNPYFRQVVYGRALTDADQREGKTRRDRATGTDAAARDPPCATGFLFCPADGLFPAAG